MASVVVVGGGPAGCAFAITAARNGHDVTMFDEHRRTKSWPGEALPAGGGELVDSIFGPGLLEAHAIAFGTTSAWGSEEVVSHDFFAHWSGRGWHLDRAVFDESLRKRTASLGVRVVNQRLSSLERRSHGWLTNEKFSSDWLVDASGRAGAVVGRMGVPARRFDEQLALVAVVPDKGGERVTVVESVEIGWWYTAPLPQGDRVVGLITDADLVGRDRVSTFTAALDATRHIRPLVGPTDSVDIGAYPAGSSIRDQLAGEGWVAVGDAAVTFDPLSSQGLITGLVMAAHAGQSFSEGLDRWEENYRAVFVEHEQERISFYAEELRWPDSPFWSRRAASPVS